MSRVTAGVLYKRVPIHRRLNIWRLHAVTCPFAMFRGEAVVLPAGYVPPRHLPCRDCLG